MVEDSPFTPKSPFSYKITTNFTYGEFTQQSEDRRFTHQHQCATALKLAEFLEELRDYFKKPVTITSGHRPPAINAAVGGAKESEHLYDKVWKGAVDVKVPGVEPLTVEKYILENWEWSVGKGQARNLGFTHVGIRGDGKPH